VTSALNQLIEQREALVARCTEQREQLAESIGGVRRGLLPAQVALSAWRAARSHPLLIGIAVVAATAAGPRRLLSLLGTALTFYSLAQRVTGLARRFHSGTNQQR